MTCVRSAGFVSLSVALYVYLLINGWWRGDDSTRLQKLLKTEWHDVTIGLVDVEWLNFLKIIRKSWQMIIVWIWICSYSVMWWGAVFNSGSSREVLTISRALTAPRNQLVEFVDKQTHQGYNYFETEKMHSWRRSTEGGEELSVSN